MGIQKTANVQYRNASSVGLRTAYQDGYDTTIAFTVDDGNVETFVNVYLTTADTRALLSSMRYSLRDIKFNERFMREFVNQFIEKYNEDFQTAFPCITEPDDD